jgi:RNA polymerase sigma-70 factor (ECF subfamily)
MGVIAESQFRSLVEQHQSMVYSIALRIAGDRGAAEEIAQDAFLESEDHVRFWLRRVTANRATDWLRRKAVRPDWSAEQWDESYEAAIADRVGGAEVRLEQMVANLPTTLRGAIVLRYQEDLEPDEIAQVLGQPVATVKSNLQRGLGLLRRKADVMLKEFKRERVG